MPTAIFVSGPTRIDWYDGSVWTELGECDNDNLPQATWNDYQHEVRTSSSGGTPEEIVLQNTDGTITFTLVKWDATELAQLEARQRGAQGTTTVGRLLVTDSGTFGIRIYPKTPGKTTYTFNRCYLPPNGLVHSNFGNVERRLGLTVKAVPDANNLLYATGTSV
jgi:hypothetical protein